LSFGGATVKFDKLLSKGAEIIQETQPTPSEPQLPLPPVETPREKALTSDHLAVQKQILTDTIARIIEWRSSGAAGILSAYNEIERLLDQIGRQLGVKARNGILMRMLVTRGLVTSEHVELYNTLREARSAAVQGLVNPSPLQIAEFTRQAAFLVAILQEALKTLKDKKK
jgi:hypothetical protein